MSWRLANTLVVFRRELNAAFPDRSKLSDGTIGDAAHQGRDSDHNPWLHDLAGVGVVRAFDATAKGIPAADLAERLRLLGRDGDPRLTDHGYIIFNRRIASAVKNWVWRDYNGSNPHEKHFHLSVSRSRGGYDDTGSWGIFGGPAQVSAPLRVTITKSDTLSLIAARNRTPMAVLRKLNPNLFDERHKNGDLVFPGELVRLR